MLDQVDICDLYLPVATRVVSSDVEFVCRRRIDEFQRLTPENRKVSTHCYRMKAIPG